jgi:glycolate oxidase FAD binding subunit
VSLETSEAGLLRPGDEAELATVVTEAAAHRTPLAIAGGGTRAGLGRPVQSAATLTASGLNGITLHVPEELVLSARAGTPLAEIEAVLAAAKQRLAFEPMDHRPLFGSSGAPTIGAVAAANISGPRRIAAGAARDSLIGLRAVTGRGDVVKSGGRVMKNVTGLDFVKFLAGSYGTLAVLSEVTFKVQPAPETEATLVLHGLDDTRAVAALSAALGSPWGVTGAAHRPPGDGEGARTFIRIDGFASSVADRCRKLAAALAGFGETELLDAGPSARLWTGIRDLALFAALPTDVVWRISLKPSDGPTVVAAIRTSLDCRVLYDWGGGLVWLACEPGRDAGAGIVRTAVAAAGGHATLVRAPADVRLAVEVFDPPALALMALTRKLKESFDPSGILNPGRMYAGV